jgi:hypothetical protein
MVSYVLLDVILNIGEGGFNEVVRGDRFHALKPKESS